MISRKIFLRDFSTALTIDFVPCIKIVIVQQLQKTPFEAYFPDIQIRFPHNHIFHSLPQKISIRSPSLVDSCSGKTLWVLFPSSKTLLHKDEKFCQHIVQTRCTHSDFSVITGLISLIKIIVKTKNLWNRLRLTRSLFCSLHIIIDSGENLKGCIQWMLIDIQKPLFSANIDLFLWIKVWKQSWRNVTFLFKQNIMGSVTWSRLLIFQSFQKVLKNMRHPDDQTHFFPQQKTGFRQPWSQFQASKIVNNWPKKNCFLHQNLDRCRTSKRVPILFPSVLKIMILQKKKLMSFYQGLNRKFFWCDDFAALWTFYSFCYLHQNRDSSICPESAFEKALFWFSISFLTITTEIFTSIKIWIENLLHVHGNAG